MATINSAFAIASGALDANQSALSIVANNVANANTTGYTQEIANWKENDPLTIGSQTFGQGVSQTGATSVRDRVLEQRLNQQQQLESASSTRLSSLNTVQTLFTPDSGSSSASAGDIGSDLTKFFSSFETLSSNATNSSYRQNVLSTAQTLAADLSGAAKNLSSQQASIDQEASGVTSQINSLTTNIAALNQQIMTTSPNSDAGVLEDQRQQDLSQLSKLVGINQITTENNGLTITTTSGTVLVAEDKSYQITNGTVSGVTHFFVGTTDITTGLTSGGGQLGGYLTARDVDIPNVMSSLDSLAYNVSTQINTLNNAGTDMAGDNTNAGNIFYQSATQAGAALSMSVVMTNTSHIAAASTGSGTGNGSNATLMYEVASSKVVNGETPSDFYSTFVSQLGATISQVSTENTAQQASVTQLKTQNNALSSVNLNDEAAAMTTLENSYQAATKVFSILNTLMSAAINLGTPTTVS